MKITCRNIRWLPLGVGIGTAVGVALDDLAVWMAIGVGVGAALDAARARR